MEIDGIPYRPCAVWWMKSSYSKTSVFVLSNERGKPAFSKTPLWRPFSKTCVFCAWKRRLRVDAISVFKNIRIPVDRALETGFKIAVLFTLLIWKSINSKLNFKNNAKNQAYLWLNVVYFWGWKIVFVERYLKEMRIYGSASKVQIVKALFYYTVNPIIATTSRKRPSPVSDDQAWSRMIDRRSLLECHKSSVLKSVDQAGWQIYSSYLTKKTAVKRSVR